MADGNVTTTTAAVFIPEFARTFSQVTMIIIIAELSGKAKLKNKLTRTEDYRNYGQGQSIADEKI